MFFTVLFCVTLCLFQFVQNESFSDCVFRKDGHKAFKAKECFYISSIASNETHVLIPVGYEYFCYVPAVYEDAAFHCLSAAEMVSPCLNVLKMNNRTECCTINKDGYEDFQPTDCIPNSLTAYTDSHALVPISPRYYCEVPFVYENVRPSCVPNTVNYLGRSRNRTIYRFPQDSSHISCDFVLEDNDDTYHVRDCLHFSALTSNETHVLVPGLNNQYCFVPKVYANAELNCAFIENIPNCRSAVRGPVGKLCCTYVKEEYGKYEPTDCMDTSLRVFNNTHLLRRIFVNNYKCAVTWKYKNARSRCVSPVVASPGKQKTDVNNNPLKQDNTIQLG